jgi:hypothetical protein
MTHDELLALLKDYASKAGLRMDRNCWLILSDVVELHKPKQIPDWVKVEGFMCWCAHMYPCPTIRAIEKELI